MPKCSMCGKEFSASGCMWVRGDSKIFYFCGTKCQSNFRLGREPARLRWVTKKK